MISGNSAGWLRIMLRIGLGLAGLVGVAIVGLSLMFWFGGNDVENFCQEATPGLPFARLAVLADKHHLRLVPGSRDGSGAYSLLAHTPRSYGRHTCLVRHDNHVVIESQNGFSD